MEYKYLGRSGLKVSELCLGTMTFGRESDKKESLKMLDTFIDAGGNFLDTADSYGPKGQPGTSEMVLGQLLKGKRDKVVISTKVGFPTSDGVNDMGLSRVHILQEVEKSLKRLQTNYIDIYHVHCWDEGTPLEETLSVLDGLIHSGKVRYIGVSNYTAWQIMKALELSRRYGWAKFVSAQMQYSLVTRDIEREILPLCQYEGLTIMAWGPLGGGFLSGKYRPGKEPPAMGARLVEVKKNEEEAWERRAIERNFRILEVVDEIAKRRKVVQAQVALAWLLKKGVIPIIGARTLDQLKVNLNSVELKISKEDVERLDKASYLEIGYPYRFISEVFPDRSRK